MGWQPGTSGRTGEEPDPGAQGRPEASSAPGGQTSRDWPARDARLAGFAPGGEWDACSPGPELAAVLAAVAGPEWRCPGAEPGELAGVLRRVAAVESWASAAKLSVIREMIRRDDLAPPGPRHGDLPDQWSESLTHELALTLASSAPSAVQTALTAWELGARLPGIAALLADGTLTFAKTRLIADTFQLLSDEDAARAEALLTPKLTGTTGKTYGQIARLADRIACQVDPGLAQRRRDAAVKHGSRVRMFREQSGAAALSGRELPVDETLAANTNVTVRANEYKASDAFSDARTDQLMATAYLDLINGVEAHERIALGRLSTDVPNPDEDQDGEDGGGTPPDGAPDGPGPGSPDGPGPGSPGGPDGPGPDGDGSCGGEPGMPGGAGGKTRPGPGSSHLPPAFGGGQRGDRPVSTDLTIPLITLLGLADRPGEAHRLGTLDPGVCRDLGRLAVVSPHTRICLTVTDPDGTAIGHGCARADKLASASSGQPRPGAPPLVRSLIRPSIGLPARLNLTVTAAHLRSMHARASGPPRRPSTRGSPGWTLAWHGKDVRVPSSDPDWCGTWMLTLPGGRELAVRIEPVPTNDCDHRHESHGYQPNDTLRHLIQVRDYTCTFPPCSRHARESDFEHAQPYDKGGRTCSCNAGARSRKCHRVKQSPGWKVTQPRPGWHQWTTPSGRTYTQAPYEYPV
jgi:hypothetical protein